jgi:hypothetical protein
MSAVVSAAASCMVAMMRRAPVVRKAPFLEPFWSQNEYSKREQFTKTGSGQTWGEHSQASTVVSQGLVAAMSDLQSQVRETFFCDAIL